MTSRRRSDCRHSEPRAHPFGSRPRAPRTTNNHEPNCDGSTTPRPKPRTCFSTHGVAGEKDVLAFVAALRRFIPATSEQEDAAALVVTALRTVAIAELLQRFGTGLQQIDLVAMNLVQSLAPIDYECSEVRVTKVSDEIQAREQLSHDGYALVEVTVKVEDENSTITSVIGTFQIAV
jgi:hypothetical protein